MKITQAFTVEAVHRLPNVPEAHHGLNEVEGLDTPTAETIAAWIWHRAKGGLRGLCAVTVFETPMSWAEFAGD
ncbi:6-pyruvoyl tetrahydropterin synthase family protein [uncultured Methylobacterium sp.]|uniref:6-pyruvoyl trahydropterin synthase family protein n=1 Tax=uncultured Methylobacterium sp. TaxID=157278 RepID=UPI0035CC8529